MNDRYRKTHRAQGAPVSRVWRALTDYREFGEWFRVKLEGPFVPGQICARPYHLSRLRACEMGGRRAEDGARTALLVHWHPYAIDPKIDYSKETPTLVEFRLEKMAGGTLLVADRIRLRQSSGGRRARSVPHERRRLDGADEEYRALCRLEAVGQSLGGAAHAPVFAALGDETRLSLVAKLCDGSPQSISQLTEGSTLTRQAITKHLRVLESAGIVRSVRVGRESLFEFEPKPMDEIKAYLDRVSAQWDDALERLKSFVED